MQRNRTTPGWGGVDRAPGGRWALAVIPVLLAAAGFASVVPASPTAAPHRHPRPVNRAIDPSGQRPPTSEPGFTRVFTSEFTGTLNTSQWGAYSGMPGGDPGGWWAPSHVITEHGMLVLRTYRDSAFGDRWVSGGVSSAPALTQTYGMYLVRFRVDKGFGIGHDILLWPAGPGWPPEVDLIESAGGDQQNATATLHWAPASDANRIQVQVDADFTKWHTLSVRWLPRRIIYVLDGHVFAIMYDHIPTVPMALDIQTQAGTCGDTYQPCPNASTPSEVDLDVDWVVAFRWDG